MLQDSCHDLFEKIEQIEKNKKIEKIEKNRKNHVYKILEPFSSACGATCGRVASSTRQHIPGNDIDPPESTCRAFQAGGPRVVGFCGLLVPIKLQLG